MCTGKDKAVLSRKLWFWADCSFQSLFVKHTNCVCLPPLLTRQQLQFTSSLGTIAGMGNLFLGLHAVPLFSIAKQGPRLGTEPFLESTQSTHTKNQAQPRQTHGISV